jgi:hypothetical protein
MPAKCLMCSITAFQRKFKFAQIKDQVLFKGEIIAKIG